MSLNLSFTLNLVILMIVVLGAVAFFTLFERKIFGVSQLRLGPNKTFMWGLGQAVSDGVKLFSNSEVDLKIMAKSVYYLSPLSMLAIVLMLWSVVPSTPSLSFSPSSSIVFLAILSVAVYPIFLSGWASGSKYAMIGSFRAIAQTISYEVSLALILAAILMWKLSASLSSGFKAMSLLLPFVFLIWLISALAETNRTPFDFAEGESELVSGFSVEYSSKSFALISLAEYGSILMFAELTVKLFLFQEAWEPLLQGAVLFLAFSWAWIRTTYPRHRYDLLMSLAWKSLLPNTLTVLFYSSLLSVSG